jgi:hypothetical protein
MGHKNKNKTKNRARFEMGVSTYVSTYQSDYSKAAKDFRGRSRSFSAAPVYKPSSGVIPTAGRPSTKSGPEVTFRENADGSSLKSFVF